jgi:hypothetical protein
VYTFPNYEVGVYDKDDHIGDVDTNMRCKYTKEGRFCSGVSAVELSDATIKGRHCETFDYSAKNLIAITAEGKNDSIINKEGERIGNKEGDRIENRWSVGRKTYPLTWTTVRK